MKTTQQSKERPEGHRYPYSRQVRLSENQDELLRRLAERWDCQQADVIRRLITEAGEREGLVQGAARPVPVATLTPEERKARVAAAFGALAHLPGSVDEFLREKHEEAAWEEERWERLRAAQAR